MTYTKPLSIRRAVLSSKSNNRYVYFICVYDLLHHVTTPNKFVQLRCMLVQLCATWYNYLQVSGECALG